MTLTNISMYVNKKCVQRVRLTLDSYVLKILLISFSKCVQHVILNLDPYILKILLISFPS